jgi:peptidoglycan L-alanyl-D-glutamate endopeptidase CwlK
MPQLSPHSQGILSSVHPDLQAVVERCVANFPLQLIVDAGDRTAEEEMALWLKCHNMDGTPNGKPHLTGCNGYAIGETAPNGCAGTGVSNHQGGLAVDILVEINGEIIWDGTDVAYKQLSFTMKKAAAELNHPLTWGGDFPPPSKPDYDHFELVAAFYQS